MDLNKIIGELLEERKRLDRIVASLEEIKSGWKVPLPTEKTRRGRKSMDEKAREEVSKRMKDYWASRRKKGVKP